MKAIVCQRYGPPEGLALEDLPMPEPKAGEVRVRVHAASVNAADWHLMRGTPFLVRLMFGLRKPKFSILGADMAGHVDAVGDGVAALQPGDAVFGDLSGCGFGAFAEYVCVPEEALAPMPAGLTFDEAAAVPMAAVTALQALRDKGQIQEGFKVLIAGASGGVGSFAVQIAKALGAEVTALGRTEKLEMVRALGADRVIDTTQEDVTQLGELYDLILDAAAYRSILAYRPLLRPEGAYVLVGGSNAQLLQTLLMGPWLSRTGGRRMEMVMAKPNRDDLREVSALIEAGSVRPVVDRRFPLHGVPDAIRHLESRKAQGKVVITVAGDEAD